MKKLVVNEQNRPDILSHLVEVNGRAWTHTFKVNDILAAAKRAECEGMDLVKNQRKLVGSTYKATSGEDLPNAYEYGRLVNELELIRCREGWAIKSLVKRKMRNRIPRSTLTLTKTAAEKAIRDFQKRFLVNP